MEANSNDNYVLVLEDRTEVKNLQEAGKLTATTISHDTLHFSYSPERSILGLKTLSIISFELSAYQAKGVKSN